MTEIRYPDYSNLLDKLRSGDEQTVIMFYNTYYKSLGYFGFSLIYDMQEAGDIATDIIIKCVELIQAGREFETIQKLKNFLYVSTRNKCFTYLRGLQSQRERQVSIEDFSEITEPVPAIEIDKSELIDEILTEIDNLPVNEKKVIVLSFIKGYSNDKICEILNLSDKTVRNLKSNALKKLRTTVVKKLILYLIFIGFCPN